MTRPFLTFLDPGDRRLLNAAARDTDPAMGDDTRADLLGRMCDFLVRCKDRDRVILGALLHPDNAGLSMRGISRKLGQPKTTVFRRFAVIRKALCR